jgi:hypothetical protein
MTAPTLHTAATCATCGDRIRLLMASETWTHVDATTGATYLACDTAANMGREVRTIAHPVKAMLVADHRGYDLIAPGRYSSGEVVL